MINPRVDGNTRVIVQGISGRAGRLHSIQMQAYGTNIVGGVSQKADASEINGIPVFRTCREAVQATGATASVALVGAMQLLEAMREAIAAGIQYLVTPTEGIPVHDALKARRLARSAGVIWIGASTPGMAVPGAAKLGFLPDESLMAGPLGLMSKSGTLSYEVGYRLAQRGIGQSVWIGVGGDPVKGTSFADLVPFFASDTETEALLVIGEIGGHDEEDLAATLKAKKFGKPVFALIAGRSAQEGVAMGHAGALVYGRHGTFEGKLEALTDSGVQVFSRLAELVDSVSMVLEARC